MKRRFRFFLSLEKEERWLNKELARGWKLINGTTGYKFEPSAPNNRTIQLDYRKFNTKDEFEEYLLFMSDSGWEHIRGSKNSGKQYFIGSISQNCEIFSDNESKIEREKRNRNALISSLAVFICLFIVFRSSDNTAIDYTLFANPQKAFFTPGLWSLTGKEFIFSFLFELPFVFGRFLAVGIIPLIIVILIILIIQRQLAIHHYKNKDTKF
ncbi:MAG: DUF2812 domain-containing protein [Muricomes sp.]